MLLPSKVIYISSSNWNRRKRLSLRFSQTVDIYLEAQSESRVSWKLPPLKKQEPKCISVFSLNETFKETNFIFEPKCMHFPKMRLFQRNQVYLDSRAFRILSHFPNRNLKIKEEWIKTNKKISFYFPEFLPLRLTWEQNSAGKTCKVSIFGDWDAFVNEENGNGQDLFFFSSNRCDWNWTLGSAFCLQHQMVRPMNAICFIGVLDFPATLSVSSPS